MKNKLLIILTALVLILSLGLTFVLLRQSNRNTNIISSVKNPPQSTNIIPEKTIVIESENEPDFSKFSKHGITPREAKYYE